MEARHILYTKLAGIYDALYQKIWDYEAQAEKVHNILSQHDVRSVLDVGCGCGHLTEKLAQRGYDIEGVDLNREMLDIAIERSEGIGFSQMDMRCLQSDRMYDAIVIMGRSFTYMTTDEDVRKVLASVHRLLNQDGILLFDVFDGEKTVAGMGNGKYKKYRHEADYGDLKIVRTSLSHELDEKTMTWTWDAIYEITEDGITRTEHDRQTTRAFFQDDLEQRLQKAGYEVIGFEKDDFLFTARKV